MAQHGHKVVRIFVSGRQIDPRVLREAGRDGGRTVIHQHIVRGIAELHFEVAGILARNRVPGRGQEFAVRRVNMPGHDRRVLIDAAVGTGTVSVNLNGVGALIYRDRRDRTVVVIIDVLFHRAIEVHPAGGGRGNKAAVFKARIHQEIGLHLRQRRHRQQTGRGRGAMAVRHRHIVRAGIRQGHIRDRERARGGAGNPAAIGENIGGRGRDLLPLIGKRIGALRRHREDRVLAFDQAEIVRPRDGRIRRVHRDGHRAGRRVRRTRIRRLRFETILNVVSRRSCQGDGEGLPRHQACGNRGIIRIVRSKVLDEGHARSRTRQ